jgi:hypothetical protein
MILTPGRYELSTGTTLTVSRGRNRLLMDSTGYGNVELFPELETKFLLKPLDV